MGDNMQAITRHAKIMLCYFKFNLASALEYRASFFTQAFGMALSNSSFIFFWWIAFRQLGGDIAGYSFRDILFIWSVTSSAYGISHVLFENAGNISQLIITGELDTFLLQPCNILVNVLCAKTSLSAYGDLAYGFILMALSHGADISVWGWFMFGVLIGGLLITAISLTAHSLTFYIGNATVLGQMTTEFVINFSIYPDKIYGSVVRALMYTLVPAGLIVHVPLRLAREFSPVTLALLIGATSVYCLFAGWFFHRGLYKYESGNVIVTRL